MGNIAPNIPLVGIVLLNAFLCLAWATPNVVPYQTLRFRGVIAQTEWFTCGPATLATLLTHYYGKPASEAEMLDLAVRASNGSPPDPDQGLSLLALKRALEFKGYSSQAYRMSASSLVNYLGGGGLPVIVHLTRPEPHFALAVAVAEGDLVLADPSTGRSILTVRGFVENRGYDGVTLIPRVTGAEAEHAHKAQDDAIQWAVRHRHQLIAATGAP